MEGKARQGWGWLEMGEWEKTAFFPLLPFFFKFKARKTILFSFVLKFSRVCLPSLGIGEIGVCRSSLGVRVGASIHDVLSTSQVPAVLISFRQ